MEKAQIDKEALKHIVGNGRGPYVRQQEDGQERYRHKDEHRGPETCAGCAVEEALGGK